MQAVIIAKELQLTCLMVSRSSFAICQHIIETAYVFYYKDGISSLSASSSLSSQR